LQAKIGWKRQLRSSLGLELFAGADNLLNEQYSLGNDINAFGKRYYNPSPINNYFGGLIVNF
jgi:iron complex outermembrane receptor protein